MQSSDREDERDGVNLTGDTDNDDNTSRVSNWSFSDLLHDVDFEGEPSVPQNDPVAEGTSLYSAEDQARPNAEEQVSLDHGDEFDDTGLQLREELVYPDASVHGANNPAQHVDNHPETPHPNLFGPDGEFISNEDSVDFIRRRHSDYALFILGRDAVDYIRRRHSGFEEEPQASHSEEDQKSDTDDDRKRETKGESYRRPWQIRHLKDKELLGYASMSMDSGAILLPDNYTSFETEEYVRSKYKQRPDVVGPYKKTKKKKKNEEEEEEEEETLGPCLHEVRLIWIDFGGLFCLTNLSLTFSSPFDRDVGNRTNQGDPTKTKTTATIQALRAPIK